MTLQILGAWDHLLVRVKSHNIRYSDYKIIFF
jgi:hypothetical protein